jgi:hypothetical protein
MRDQSARFLVERSFDRGRPTNDWLRAGGRSAEAVGSALDTEAFSESVIAPEGVADRLGM